MIPNKATFSMLIVHVTFKLPANILLNSSSWYLIWQKVNKVIIFKLPYQQEIACGIFFSFLFYLNLSNFIYDEKHIVCNIAYKLHHIQQKITDRPSKSIPDTQIIYHIRKEK